jgi:hypothetical protein
MKISFYIIVAALVLGGCTQTVPLAKYEKSKADHQKYLAYLKLFDVSEDVTLLELLREGKTDEVIAFIEHNLDGDIVVLKETYFEKSNDDFKKDALQMLQLAKKYREKHPRELSGANASSSDYDAERNILLIVNAFKEGSGFEDALQKVQDNTASAADEILRNIQ